MFVRFAFHIGSNKYDTECLRYQNSIILEIKCKRILKTPWKKCEGRDDSFNVRTCL